MSCYLSVDENSNIGLPKKCSFEVSKHTVQQLLQKVPQSGGKFSTFIRLLSKKTFYERDKYEEATIEMHLAAKKWLHLPVEYQEELDMLALQSRHENRDLLGSLRQSYKDIQQKHRDCVNQEQRKIEENILTEKELVNSNLLFQKIKKRYNQAKSNRVDSKNIYLNLVIEEKNCNSRIESIPSVLEMLKFNVNEEVKSMKLLMEMTSNDIIDLQPQVKDLDIKNTTSTQILNDLLPVQNTNEVFIRNGNKILEAKLKSIGNLENIKTDELSKRQLIYNSQESILLQFDINLKHKIKVHNEEIEQKIIKNETVSDKVARRNSEVENLREELGKNKLQQKDYNEFRLEVSKFNTIVQEEHNEEIKNRDECKHLFSEIRDEKNKYEGRRSSIAEKHIQNKTKLESQLKTLSTTSDIHIKESEKASNINAVLQSEINENKLQFLKFSRKIDLESDKVRQAITERLPRNSKLKEYIADKRKKITEKKVVLTRLNKDIITITAGLQNSTNTLLGELNVVKSSLSTNNRKLEVAQKQHEHWKVTHKEEDATYVAVKSKWVASTSKKTNYEIKKNEISSNISHLSSKAKKRKSERQLQMDTIQDVTNRTSKKIATFEKETYNMNNEIHQYLETNKVLLETNNNIEIYIHCLRNADKKIMEQITNYTRDVGYCINTMLVKREKYNEIHSFHMYNGEEIAEQLERAEKSSSSRYEITTTVRNDLRHVLDEIRRTHKLLAN